MPCKYKGKQLKAYYATKGWKRPIRKFGTYEFGEETFLTNPRTGDIILTKAQFNRLVRRRKKR